MFNLGQATAPLLLYVMRLDSRTNLPSGMEDYLEYYGWHFSKKMCEWAVSEMYRRVNGKKTPIQPYTKDVVDALLKRYNITLENNEGYDATYVANMCKADYLGSSIRTESDLAMFVKDTIDDPDGYEGMAFTRFYADCIGSGKPIVWEDML